jgi:hypothetical protein
MYATTNVCFDSAKGTWTPLRSKRPRTANSMYTTVAVTNVYLTALIFVFLGLGDLALELWNNWDLDNSSLKTSTISIYPIT